MVRIDSLLSLLASGIALLGLLPLLPYLDRPLLLLSLAAVVVGPWCDRHGRHLLGRLPATLFAIAGLVFYALQALQITRDEVATPIVHALVVLMVVRLLSPKESRDYLQIFVLGLFILAGSSLLNLSIVFIIDLVLLIFAVTIGLVLLTVYVTDAALALPRQELFKTLRVALILPVVSLLLMLLFFTILPRTRHPMWNFLNPVAQATAGLSEVVQPGAFARMSGTTQLAFRAETPALSSEDLYWRVLVLNQPQGNRWHRVEPPDTGSNRLEGGRLAQVTLYPEPRQDRYLITLDQTVQLSGIRHRQTIDHMFVARSALTHRYSLEVTARLGASLRQVGGPPRSFYLTLPDRIGPRVRALAEQIVAQHPDPDDRLLALAEFYRNQDLAYAETDLAGGEDPVDDFLFGKQRGYCEFFASSYITLARLAGLPARLVGGYFGGEYNDLGGYYLVGEDRAHVWVEVLTTDNHWVRVDPSLWANNAATALANRQPTTWQQLQRVADTFNYYWIQSVVIFDLQRQIRIFHDAGNQIRNLNAKNLPSTLWVALAGTGLLVGSFWLIRRRPRLSTEARLVTQLRRHLRRRRWPGAAAEHLGLNELAEQSRNTAVHRFAQIYQAAIFCDRRLAPDEVKQLKKLLKEI